MFKIFLGEAHQTPIRTFHIVPPDPPWEKFLDPPLWRAGDPITINSNNVVLSFITLSMTKAPTKHLVIMNFLNVCILKCYEEFHILLVLI